MCVWGGALDVVPGFINVLRVFHQFFEHCFSDFNLSANCFMWYCLALRINSNVSFLNFLNLHHKSGLFALFAFLYNRLRLRICLFKSDVIHIGSVGFILPNLLGFVFLFSNFN